MKQLTTLLQGNTLMTTTTQTQGIALNINQVTTGHVGIACEFYYKGSQAVATLREGKLEAVKDGIITLAMKEGGYKSFTKSEIKSIFLYT